MSKSIEQRALSGAVSGGANFGVTLLQNLITVPILLGLWGEGKYGVWVAINAATAMLATLDAGHQSYLGNEFNKDINHGYERFRSRLASGLRMATVLGATQVVIALLVVYTSSLDKFLGLKSEELATGNLNVAFILWVLNWAVFGSVAGVLVRVYAPLGRFADIQWIGIAQRLLQFGILVAVACLGGFILSYTVANCIFCIVFSLFWFSAVRRAFPQIFPWWKGGSWREAWGNLTRSTVVTVNGVVVQAGSNGLPLLLASQLGVATIPLFTTVRTVANTFSQVSLVLTNPLLPDLIRFHVNGEFRKLMGAFRACWFLGGVVINLGLMVAIPFIPWLYQIWTRHRIEFNFGLFAMLAGSVAVRCAYNPLAAYVIGLNHLRAQSVANGLQTGITLLVPLLFTAKLGLYAFGIGIVAGEVVAMACYVWFAAHELGGRFRELIRIFSLEAFVPVGVLALNLAGNIAVPAQGLLIGGISFVSMAFFYAWRWTCLPVELREKFVRVLSGPLRRFATR